jgi:hypothetical protein
MTEQSRPRRRPARILAIGLFALAMAELATEVAAALAGTISWANAAVTRESQVTGSVVRPQQ